MRAATGVVVGIAAAVAAIVGVAAGCAGNPGNDCASQLACSPEGGDDGISPADATSDTTPAADHGNGDQTSPKEGGEAGVAEGGDGEAGPGCVAPLSLNCNGTCVDPTLPTHCGTCGNICEGPDAGSGGATCTNGACGIGCDQDSGTPLNCRGACVNPAGIANCGSCGNTCPGPTAGTGTAQCTLKADGGVCSVECSDAGTSQLCGAACYSPTDLQHCGSCSTVCAAPPSGHGMATCSGVTAACGVSCNAGYHTCSGDCLPNTDTPSVTTDPCIVSEAFGVFVSPAASSSDSNAATQLSPVKTIGKAMQLAKAAGKRVYACGNAGTYTENLVVAAAVDGVSVYAGLDCTTAPSQWAYNAADKGTLAPPSGYALQIQGLATGVTFEDFAFAAAAATGAGASSIAVFAASSSGVVLRRCGVQAGAGVTGQAGTQPAPFSAAAATGNAGTLTAGGAATPNPACTTSVGGAGGAPGASGNDGSDGQPGSSNKGTAMGCVGGSNGGAGTVGGAGASSAGAATWATFAAGGWSPTSGQTGQTGSVGQGGGGGGSPDLTGGGGAGGAGGCGGAGGGGGGGGGSSIAVLLFDTSADLESCTLTTTNAGGGGAGAQGQTGQTGGTHGSQFGNACLGGKGGVGGNGGQGGGGAGGLSAGVVWTGTAPTINGTSTPSATTLAGVTLGTAGAAGTGGSPAATAGAAGAVVQFQ
jgi:hypothetical protein